MPTNEYGEHADLVINALGVLNRLNPAQLYELELNFISDNIVRKSKSLKSYNEKAKLLLTYINDVNKKQGKFMKEKFKSLDNKGKKALIDDLEINGIYLHQPPFFDNVNFDELRELYHKYDWIKPYQCTIKGKKIEKPLIIGDEYILRLKHEASNKLSARSTSFLNMTRVPSRSNTFKKNQDLYSKTPIRLGEMETINLFLMEKPELVSNFLAKYSSSDEMRELFIQSIVTGNALDVEEVLLSNYYSGDDLTEHGINNNKEILDVRMKSLGLSIERDLD